MSWVITLNAVVLALAMVGAPSAHAVQSWRNYYHNRSALGALEEKDPVKAIGEIQKGLSGDGLDAVMQYNLGVALEQQRDFEAAAKQFAFAARLTNDPDLKFESLFNSARNLAENKKIPEALQAYQKALSVRPNSVEVKTNIELLMQQNQGGGDSDQENQSEDKKDGDKDGDKPKDKDQRKPESGKKPDQRQQPRKFKSEEMTEQDVRRILDELKRQEEKIRAKEYNKNPQKERSNEKDW
jgi:Ca-activated chloride channel family protein